jgi:hypothetical protein
LRDACFGPKLHMDLEPSTSFPRQAGIQDKPIECARPAEDIAGYPLSRAVEQRGNLDEVRASVS